MKPKQFIQALDKERITAGIAAAERTTSGQIRVFITHHGVDDVLAAAHACFAKLGMKKTAARNAVLLYFAPEARKYALVGDQGIHERCGGDEFWQTLVDTTMKPLLKAERYTDAIVATVKIIGAELARHFPRVAGEQVNELPDAVEED